MISFSLISYHSHFFRFPICVIQLCLCCFVISLFKSYHIIIVFHFAQYCAVILFSFVKKSHVWAINHQSTPPIYTIWYISNVCLKSASISSYHVCYAILQK
jgi:hypothetical protein